MNVNDKITCKNGGTFEIVRCLEGGSLWLVRATDSKEEFYFKLISDQRPSERVGRIENVKQIVSIRPYHQEALIDDRLSLQFPIDIYETVDWNGTTSDFGYVVDIPKGECLADMMRGGRFTQMTMDEKLILVRRLAEMSVKLRRCGLVYGYLDPAMFCYDTKSGHLTLTAIDCVLSGVSVESSPVSGIGFYTAPELAFHLEEYPTHATDNYQLAVLFYLILMAPATSPYHGRAFYALENIPTDMRQAAEMTLDDPEIGRTWLHFVFDPQCRLNAIDPDLYSNPVYQATQEIILDCWKETPDKIKELFFRVFLDPFGEDETITRPDAKEWMAAIEDRDPASLPRPMRMRRSAPAHAAAPEAPSAPAEGAPETAEPAAPGQSAAPESSAEETADKSESVTNDAADTEGSSPDVPVETSPVSPELAPTEEPVLEEEAAPVIESPLPAEAIPPVEPVSESLPEHQPEPIPTPAPAPVEDQAPVPPPVAPEQRPAPAPSPAPQPQRSAPAPSPAPQPLRPAPAPSPAPQPQRPAPAPSPAPQPQRPAPAPSPAPQPQRPTPAPSPAPQPQRPAPAPSPVPQPQRSAPAPSPAPQPQRPAPAPSPAPQPQRPAPAPTPAPVPPPAAQTPPPAPTPSIPQSSRAPSVKGQIVFIKDKRPNGKAIPLTDDFVLSPDNTDGRVRPVMGEIEILDAGTPDERVVFRSTSPLLIKYAHRSQGDGGSGQLMKGEQILVHKSVNLFFATYPSEIVCINLT